jgi:hypothetical protein
MPLGQGHCKACLPVVSRLIAALLQPGHCGMSSLVLVCLFNVDTFKDKLWYGHLLLWDLHQLLFYDNLCRRYRTDGHHIVVLLKIT